MATATPVSIEKYLGTAYDSDREYLDGELVERNTGEPEHSSLQGIVAGMLGNKRQELGIHVYLAMRMRVTATRYRIPDIAVTTERIPARGALATAPFLCIEILSPDDRASRIEVKIDEYFRFGVKHVWVIDPRERKAWAYFEHTRTEAGAALETTDPRIRLELSEIFSELDDDLEF